MATLMADMDDPADGRRDFDFIFGTWDIANRKLVDQLDPDCEEWIEFATTSSATPVFGGLAHVDLITATGQVPGGSWQGLTLRQFDPAARLWRIWWASSRNPGRLDPPLTGRFEAGVGRFLGTDEIGNTRLRIRFEWTSDGTDAARWVQFFAFDDQEDWRANWVMDFTRRGPADALASDQFLNSAL